MGNAPIDETATLEQLTRDPYSLYHKYRAESPVVRVTSINRTMITKAADTKMVKDNWELYSSDDPTTPMERAFQYTTLMRKDGAAHARERGGMATAFSPTNIKNTWLPLYQKIAEEYIGRLPKGETVDLFSQLAAPISAQCLSHLLGLTNASDDDMCRWSQILIDGAGNFGFVEDLFEKSDAANDEINKCIADMVDENTQEARPNALSVMLNSDDPLDIEAIQSNLKIAIGGGINEPRDAMCTAVYGLLTNPDQLAAVKDDAKLWMPTFEETVRWIAPIQASSRRATEDAEIRGVEISKGEIVMTVQASACHDEELYDDPHLFNIHRKSNRHQAFGNGPHFCMGTHIARRMIADIVLPMLFDRFPNMKLEKPEEVVFWGFGFRGPLSMPILLQ